MSRLIPVWQDCADQDADSDVKFLDEGKCKDGRRCGRGMVSEGTPLLPPTHPERLAMITETIVILVQLP
jgi:hypothetical protein